MLRLKMATENDCFRACVASMLHRHEVTSVPDFYAGLEAGTPVPEEILIEMEVWFSSRGLRLIFMPVASACYSTEGLAVKEVSAVIENCSTYNPSTLFILTGQTRKGREHAVVCYNGIVLHDPAPIKQPIVAPQRNGYYGVYFIAADLASDFWLENLADYFE